MESLEPEVSLEGAPVHPSPVPTGSAAPAATRAAISLSAGGRASGGAKAEQAASTEEKAISPLLWWGLGSLAVAGASGLVFLRMRRA